jgi:hypothetical protein
MVSHVLLARAGSLTKGAAVGFVNAGINQGSISGQGPLYASSSPTASVITPMAVISSSPSGLFPTFLLVTGIYHKVMCILHLTHLGGIQASDGSARSGCDFRMDNVPFALELENAARATAVCIKLKIRQSEQSPLNGKGKGGTHFATDHISFFVSNCPRHIFLASSVIIMPHFDGFNTLAARSVDGKVGRLLVFFVDLYTAKGSMLPWYLYIKRKVDAKYPNRRHGQNAGEVA